MIYESDRDSPIELAELITSGVSRFYGFTYRPPTWEANTVYVDGNSVVPTVPSGRYYLVDECGKSGATEPTDWTVADGTVTWKEYCYKLLPTGVTITASTWTCDNASVTLTLSTFDDDSTRVLVGNVPNTVTSITLTNTTTRSNQEVEVRSMIIPVGLT